jgi:hypothetical protein
LLAAVSRRGSGRRPPSLSSVVRRFLPASNRPFIVEQGRKTKFGEELIHSFFVDLVYSLLYTMSP